LHAEVAGLMLRIVVNLVKTMIPLLARHPYAAHWMEVWNYLIRCTRRFGRVLERIAAGDSFPVRKSRAGAVRKERARPRLAIPRRKDWIGQLGWQMRGCNLQIAYLLDRPEVAALIASSPQAQRALRPMFHILGVEVACVPPLPRPVTAGHSRPRKPLPKKVSTKPKRLTRKEREAILWYPNSEGKPMKLLPRRLPRD
ncbi:MAG: hypothetical protein NT133_09320, partial [Alphaproteobacteria bacterium]|nr:hypothetical protein [Alphaproteobacteria bacterium]